MNTDALIVGAGIAGLTAAISLAHKGWSVLVLEAAPVLEEVGAGIQLGPNATKSLRKLGLADALRPHAFAPEGIDTRDGLSGARLARLALGRAIETEMGAPYWTVHRRDLQRVLLNAAEAEPSITIKTSTRIDGIEQSAAGVRLRSTRMDFTGRIAIAADGVWSHLRTCVSSGARAVPRGHTASRASVPTDWLDTDTVADINLATDVGLWLLPDCHVVHYPVAGGKLLNMVVLRGDDWTERTWRGDVSAADVMRDLRSAHRALHDIVDLAEHWQRWPLAELPALETWFDNRLVIIGDAAHPVLPYLAQGAAFAIEDAVVLADELAGEPDRPSAAFAAFEARRKRRASRLQRAARRNGRIYHLTGIPRLVRNQAMQSLPPTALMMPYRWIYQWDPDDRSHS